MPEAGPVEAGEGPMEAGADPVGVETFSTRVISMEVGPAHTGDGAIPAGVVIHTAVGLHRYRLQSRPWSLLTQLIIIMRVYIIKGWRMDMLLFQRL